MWYVVYGLPDSKLTLHLLLLNTESCMIFWKRSVLSIIELEGKLYDAAVCRGITTFSHSDFIPVQSPSLQHPPQLFQPMSLPQP